MNLPFGITSLAAKYIGGALAIVLAITAFMLWLNHRENAAVESDRAKAAVEVLTTARRADAAAQATTAAIQNETERTNDDARKAAVGSVDPLADGFSSLRNRKARAGAPAR